MVCLLLVAYSLTPGVSGQVALAAQVALIALVIYHLTIHTRDLPHKNQDSVRHLAFTVKSVSFKSFDLQTPPGHAQLLD